MRHEKSCGALVYRYENDALLLLLLRHRHGGHWAFPKGHVEAGGTEGVGGAEYKGERAHGEGRDAGGGGQRAAAGMASRTGRPELRQATGRRDQKREKRLTAATGRAQTSRNSSRKPLPTAPAPSSRKKTASTPSTAPRMVSSRLMRMDT